MTPPGVRSRLLALLAAPALLLAACGAGGSPAAVVGGDEIGHDQLARDVELFRFLSALAGTPCGTVQPGETEGSACTRFTLSNLIQEDLIQTYAAERDLAVEEADVTGAIARLEQSLGGPAELQTRLAEFDLTRVDLEALARRLLLFDVVQRAVVEERLGDAELRDAYEQEQAQFTTVEVRHILFETRGEAERIAARLTPERFASFAERFSIDPGSAPNGGSIGVYSEAQFRAQFDPTFVDAALALRPGEVSEPVRTRFGWHLIELVRRDVASFEDVRDQLVAQQGPRVFDEWLRERYATVAIDVNPRYGRLNPDTGEVLPVRSTAGDPPAAEQPAAP